MGTRGPHFYGGPQNFMTPVAMPFYALATRPLIDSLSRDTPELRQIWYADDASAGGKLTNLKKWWDNLLRVGPSFGYFVNPHKTWLVTKDNFLSSASEMFEDAMVNITTDGRPCSSWISCRQT